MGGRIMALRQWNQLNIIEKIFIKEWAQRRFNMRYHTRKPNSFNVLNELEINLTLSEVLPTKTIK
jgi:hypothetical protein